MKIYNRVDGKEYIYIQLKDLILLDKYEKMPNNIKQLVTELIKKVTNPEVFVKFSKKDDIEYIGIQDCILSYLFYRYLHLKELDEYIAQYLNMEVNALYQIDSKNTLKKQPKFKENEFIHNYLDDLTSIFLNKIGLYNNFLPSGILGNGLRFESLNSDVISVYECFDDATVYIVYENGLPKNKEDIYKLLNCIETMFFCQKMEEGSIKSGMIKSKYSLENEYVIKLELDLSNVYVRKRGTYENS